MVLTESEVRGLARHIGYGNPAAPLWFVGGEEGLGGSMSAREQADNLTARASWEPVMDMAAAHRTLREAGGFIEDLIDRPGATMTWRFMARIARAFEGAADWDDAAGAADYVRHQLGRDNGQTFLTELRPFPAQCAQPPGLSEFPDRGLIDAVLGERQGQQMELLHRHRPLAVICYGASLRDRFARHFGLCWELFETIEWRSAKSGARRCTPLYCGRIGHPAHEPTRAFLLPFLGNGAIGAPVLRGFIATGEFQRCRS